MPLPKHNQKHTYEADLPSGRKVKFRPWIVREEQEYMYATEGLENSEGYIPHIEQLIQKCVVGDLDIMNLSEVDFLSLVVDIRKKSKGETHEVIFTCPHCQTINDEIYIDLNVDIKQKPMNTTPIEIGDSEYTFRDLTRKNLAKLKTMD